MGTARNTVYRKPWNKRKLVGQKVPFKLRDFGALRVRMQVEGRVANWLSSTSALRRPWVSAFYCWAADGREW